MFNLKNSYSNIMQFMSYHKSDILTGVGIIGSVGACVLASRATLKADKVVKEYKESMEQFKGDVPEEKADEVKKAIRKETVKMATKVGLLYLPAAAAEAMSITCFCKSNANHKKNYAQLSAVALATESMFNRYRKNVKEELGEDADRRFRFGIKEKEVDVVSKDEDGNDIVEKKKVQVVDSADAEAVELGYSDYARFFDEGCEEWDKNPEMNLTFLRIRQHEANTKLQRQGHLYLNEVYDMLGIPRTSAGQEVGWIYDLNNPVGDNFVDFGIYDIHRPKNRDFVNGYENVVLLDFNVDGNIRQRLYGDM